MSENNNSPSPAQPMTAHEKLAELVEKKKAEAGRANRGIPGQRQTERAAAARAMSKSRPASRK